MGLFDKIFGNKDKKLAEIALNGSTAEERREARASIKDLSILAEVLMKSDDDDFKYSVHKLKGNDKLLAMVAVNTQNKEIGFEAVHWISEENVGVLAAIADKAKNYHVRDKASMKIISARVSDSGLKIGSGMYRV